MNLDKHAREKIMEYKENLEKEENLYKKYAEICEEYLKTDDSNLWEKLEELDNRYKKQRTDNQNTARSIMNVFIIPLLDNN